MGIFEVFVITALDEVIQTAYNSPGSREAVNRVYLKFLQATFWVPIQKTLQPDGAFTPLFSKFEDRYFMPIFDTSEKLTAWADRYLSEMGTVELLGSAIILGVNEKVYLSLNLGTPYHKEFSPDEILYLKKIAVKIENLKAM